jgi:hypothetical protein
MTNDKLNDLLQEWAAIRIRFSSEHGHHPARLTKIMDGISEAEPERQPSSLECAPQLGKRPVVGVQNPMPKAGRSNLKA